MKERHKIHAAVYLVLMQEDKVLLLKRSNTGYKDGKYSLPSGHIDGNESAQSALIREAKEEVGLSVLPKNLKLVHTMHRNIDNDDQYGYEYIDLYFQATAWGGEPYNAEPQKCSELAWYAINSLPENIIPEVLQALLNITEGKSYSDINF